MVGGGRHLACVFRRASLWGSELYFAGVSWLVACRLMCAFACTPICAYSANKGALANTHKQISSSGEKQRVKRECRFHREGGSRGCVYFLGCICEYMCEGWARRARRWSVTIPLSNAVWRISSLGSAANSLYCNSSILLLSPWNNTAVPPHASPHKESSDETDARSELRHSGRTIEEEWVLFGIVLCILVADKQERKVPRDGQLFFHSLETLRGEGDGHLLRRLTCVFQVTSRALRHM